MFYVKLSEGPGVAHEKVFKKSIFFSPRPPMIVSANNFSPIGPAVSPAKRNIYIYMLTINFKTSE